MPKQKTESILYEVPNFPYAAMIDRDRITSFIDVATSDEVTPDEILKKGKWEYWMETANQWKARVSPLPKYEGKIFSADTIEGLRAIIKTLRNNGVPEPMLEPIIDWTNSKEKLIHVG